MSVRLVQKMNREILYVTDTSESSVADITHDDRILAQIPSWQADEYSSYVEWAERNGAVCTVTFSQGEGSLFVRSTGLDVMLNAIVTRPIHIDRKKGGIKKRSGLNKR